ncbi:DUF3987 domain-containing protein [Bacteroides reticulotermitis]|uniref:DUF3987 domain-containing protein n=1 Tax=Bacteroides reticulotermitis TaxID=1133319 RepID=UPI003A8A1C68
MKPLDEIYVSVYDSVYSKKPKDVSFAQVIGDCIRPVYASSINTIRKYHADGDHEAAQKLKSKLPCFTPAGTFDGAHAIRNYRQSSHIVGLDYDHVANREEVLRQCAGNPYTVAVIESPTDGIKVFAYVENSDGRYREAQQLVASYYDRLLGMESDPACKDESRLCYFSFSPNGYMAALFDVFTLEPVATVTACQEMRTQPEEVTPPFEMNPVDNVAPTPSDEETKLFVSSYIFLNPLTSGKRHTNLFKLACEACRRHYSEKAILRELCTHLEGTNFPMSELKAVLSSGFKEVNSKRKTVSNVYSEFFQKDKWTNAPYDHPKSDADAEESYWQGEELRKTTPVFPDGLYKNLPELLNDCMLEECTSRERDISFLSNLTALSAVLPYTFGIYNHKKYSPHLYSVVIAPAGSGKSIAQTGRYLIEEIHSQILANSDQLQRNYKSAHNAWQAQTSRKNKSEHTESEEPQAPPFRMLIIPATTSYTRMQLQMQDNGTQGSIIFDTEAQTLSNANHLDCGNFDNIICKCFEHENIDSSYKANGIRPIYIRHPMLALFLTGTPGQLNGLLENTENGMASRIIYYTFREAPFWKEMGDNAISFEEHFQLLAQRVTQLYNFCLNHPVMFHFSNKQWNQLNKLFAKLLTDIPLENNDDLQAVIKRHAFLVMRISMIQTRIRQFENNDISPDIYCADIDFEHSLQIVLCCYEHSRLLLSSMPSGSSQPLKDPNINKEFFNELPDCFTREDANQVGAKYNFNPRKISRLLKAAIGLRINKITHGVYQKITN